MKSTVQIKSLQGIVIASIVINVLLLVIVLNGASDNEVSDKASESYIKENEELQAKFELACETVMELKKTVDYQQEQMNSSKSVAQAIKQASINEMAAAERIRLQNWSDSNNERYKAKMGFGRRR